MITLQYRRADGTFVALVDGLPYHVAEGDALLGIAQEIADELGDNLQFEPAPPEPEDPGPVEVEPVRVACALRIPIIDGEVQQIGGAFRVMAMVLMNEGTFLAIFSQDLGAEPYVIPNNGVCVDITDWGGDYAMLEVRDHAGGSLITPASFGFSLYQI
ncbi:hypothetical protein ACQKP1_15805 [Allorhizobium sp. NPDC080224]|uniref:hypothetical protein n=1 Tax=Allorhizobium sp. NPDC080224 TaxID=3390547 RepID=UPI003D083ADE